ncbi:MAG: polyprenol monophosphomannose synthase [Solirubrobacterales bacterium]|nr:polyprenol monophosphomannose synthase [Solirubrobacterales bacterium]OJU96071.1 MAG: dolichyl-phosphate beta-D-mannosyltransferase [Solirubrobacterales bacterium 67-14]
MPEEARTEHRGAAWVILPTYNEAGNIGPMVEALDPKLTHEGDRILIVDDNSPDGTGLIADEISTANPRVEVLHRARKQGLGPAYLEGFRAALDGGAELVVQMDADFSHDPAYLPRLLAASELADLVIGSRYVPGGGITEWGQVRRLLSRGGSLYSRAILRVPVRDMTGGFKCFRREVLESIDLSEVAASGYSFQVEMTWRVARAGFSIMEVPITFRERQEGDSKMTTAIVAEAAWRVPILRLRRK